jgi:hypothetical protein
MLLSLSAEARAWGETGHRVVCEIEWRSAAPGTRAEIRREMRAKRHAFVSLGYGLEISLVCSSL